jgi:PAS domain S-box-containing protein
MEKRSKEEQRSLFILVSIFVIFSAGIIAAGYLYYSNCKTQYKTDIGKQLTAVGKLKAEGLAHWRESCLADGRVFYRNNAFSTMVGRYFKDPNDADAREQIRAWLSGAQATYQCEWVLLLDEQFHKKMIIPDGPERPVSYVSEYTSKLLQSGEITFEDLYWNEQNQQTYLKVLVPIFEENGSRMIGVLAMRIDPKMHLYPYISSWPVPSVTTAKTLLVRRKGESVEYLNELKFQKGTALMSERSLANKDLPAAKAVLGYEGIVDGIDYRGVPVIADVRAVADSPWFLVIRMDISEIYAPLRQRLLVVIAFAAILLGGVGAGFGLVWRRLRVRFYKEQYESAKKWCTTFDSLPDWVSIVGRDFKFRLVNKTFADVFGKRPGELLGKKCCKLIHNTKEPPEDCPLRKTLSTGKAAKLELYYDVLKKHLEVSTLPIFGDNGEVIEAVHFIRDITERKLLEEARKKTDILLQNALRFNSNIISNASVGVIVYDSQLRYLEWNTFMENLTGIEKKDAIGKDAMGVCPPLQEQGIDKLILRALAGEIVASPDIMYRCPQTGKTSWVAGTYTPHRNSIGQIIGVIGIIRDITERKQAEEALRESEKRFQQIAENAQEWIWETDANGLYTYASPIIEKLLGYKPKDLVRQKYFYDLFISEERETLKKAAFEVFARKEPFQTFENRNVHKNGSIVWFITSGVPMLDAAGNLLGYRGADTNITERKQAEEMLRQSKQELERLNEQLMRSIEHSEQMTKQAIEAYEAKGQFLANISHEIRTPMNAIIGFSEILADEKMPEYQKEYVEFIRQSSEHLLNLINDILDFSKADIGKLELKETVFFLSKIVDAVESQMRPEAEKKGLKFDVIQCGDLPAQIRGDPDRMQQCLVNLVDNAVKFTEKGYVQVKVSQEHKEDKSFIRFDIEDTGIGIPADKNEEIFESFVQLDASASRKYGGTGLGLTITRRLAKLLGGQLTVTSELGKGSVFSLIVPTNIGIYSQTNIEPAHTSELECQDAAITEPAEFSGRALVAEDVITNQKLITHLLERMGLEVTIVDDGNKAVQKANGQLFDIIFMDIQMPNMNGYEAAKAIRKQGIKTPIVALTAYVMLGDEQKCIEAGCDDYLSKPLVYSKLVRIIDKYLGGAASAVRHPQADSESADLTDKSRLRFATAGKPADRKDANKVETIDEVVIDWTKITAGGLDEQVIKEVMPTYLEESRKHIQELISAVNTSNAKDVKLHAHAIKGAGRNLGITRLSEAAGQLEIMAAQGDLSKAQELLKKVTDEFEKFEKFVSKPAWIEIAKGKATLESRA